LGTLVPNATNYRCDVTGNNQINTGDVGFIRTLGTLSLVSVPEPTIPPSGMALEAAESPTTTSTTLSSVSDVSQLSSLIAEAIARWSETGLTASQQATLESVQFEVVDFGDCGVLAVSQSGLIRIDDDAAGWGWFVDSTPSEDEEFMATASDGQLQASADSLAAGREDLLTVIMHELGHQLGLVDEDVSEGTGALMDGTLPSGTRRLPAISRVVATSTDAGQSATDSGSVREPFLIGPFSMAEQALAEIPAIPFAHLPIEGSGQEASLGTSEEVSPNSIEASATRSPIEAALVDRIVTDWAILSEKNATISSQESEGLPCDVKPACFFDESASSLLATAPAADYLGFSDNVTPSLRNSIYGGLSNTLKRGDIEVTDDWLSEDGQLIGRPLTGRWKLGTYC